MNWTDFVKLIETDVGGEVDESLATDVLQYVSRYVPAIDANAMRGAVPDRVVEILADESDLVDELLAPPFEVVSKLSLEPGATRELVFAVCARLDRTLGPEARKHFRRNLGDELVATFEEAPESRQFATGHGHHISDGRPGSTKPLSEANPAQSDSIAADKDPHGDTKLSGARGTTQEREHRTLAEGEAGSTRPLSTHEP